MSSRRRTLPNSDAATLKPRLALVLRAGVARAAPQACGMIRRSGEAAQHYDAVRDTHPPTVLIGDMAMLDDDEDPRPVPLVFDKAFITSVEITDDVLPPVSRSEGRDGILVRRVPVFPRPSDAVDPYQIFLATIDSLGYFLLQDASFSEAALETRLRNLLRLPSEPLMGFRESVVFLGHYLATVVMTMNCFRYPPWGGPITKDRKYPWKRAQEIWYAVSQDEGRVSVLRSVLRKMCPGGMAPGASMHPFEQPSVGKPILEDPKYAIIDTMGGIIDMLMTHPAGTSPGFDRELLIATNGVDDTFVGYIFVTLARTQFLGVRGAFPYGISRSVFYLPGTCTTRENAEGFVRGLFVKMYEIMVERDINAAFTFPLEKMKKRFVDDLKWRLIEKGPYNEYIDAEENAGSGDSGYAERREKATARVVLSKAAKSVFGDEAGAKFLTQRLKHWDFVLWQR